jgi:hypothetical protein
MTIISELFGDAKFIVNYRIKAMKTGRRSMSRLPKPVISPRISHSLIFQGLNLSRSLIFAIKNRLPWCLGATPDRRMSRVPLVSSNSMSNITKMFSFSVSTFARRIQLMVGGWGGG